MTTAGPLDTGAGLAGAVRHHRVLDFYARQMQAMDSGDAKSWADTFTPDGVFEATAHPVPQRGRVEIRAAAERAHRDLTERGVRRRHWLHMVAVTAIDEHTWHSSFYALVVSTPVGGATAIQFSCTGTDEIDVSGPELLVRRRLVRRDDLPEPAGE